MTLEEAKELLNQCTRHECRDHAFGDREIYFTMGTVDVAEGYAGGGLSDIVIHGASPEEDARFKGKEADELFECGAIGGIERNDSTGPDEYREGECLPGLTAEGVRDELVSPLVDFSKPISEGYRWNLKDIHDVLIGGGDIGKFNQRDVVSDQEYRARKEAYYCKAKEDGATLIASLSRREHNNLSLRAKVIRKRWIAYVKSL